MIHAYLVLQNQTQFSLYFALTTDSNLMNIWLTDKKNENKEVAVDDFLGAESAVAAISHSM